MGCLLGVFFILFPLLLLGVILAGFFSSPPSARQQDLEPAPSEVDLLCLRYKGHFGPGGPCEIDSFEFQEHTCIRWHSGYGSDLECWPTTTYGVEAR
jgi:hypothetical protein